MVTPNRIVLISHGRHDEAPADADCWPGMMISLQADGGAQAFSVAGGIGPICIAKEDALRGGDITQKLPSGYVLPFHRPANGDKMLCLLQFGQNVAARAALMNAGDGTLIAAPTDDNKLYQITAPSAVVTNQAGETTFSNGSYSIPANFLQVGDEINITGRVTCIAVNSTNTHNVKVYIGTGNVASGAQALVAGNVIEFNINFTIRTITASGTVIGSGTFTCNPGGVVGVIEVVLASTTLDSTIAEIVKVTVTASAQSAGNQVQLDELFITLNRVGGFTIVAEADEAINNSAGAGSSPMSGYSSGGGAAAFIRAIILG